MQHTHHVRPEFIVGTEERDTQIPTRNIRIHLKIHRFDAVPNERGPIVIGRIPNDYQFGLLRNTELFSGDIGQAVGLKEPNPLSLGFCHIHSSFIYIRADGERLPRIS